MSGRCSLMALVFTFVVGVLFSPVLAAGPVIGIDGLFDLCGGGYGWSSIYVDNWEALPNIGGFDLLISYDASALTLVDALPGSMPNTCGWEYFTYRSGANGNCNGPCPSGFVRLVGLADINNGDHYPSCYLSGVYGNLARMKFFLTSEVPEPGLFSRIRFYWIDCSDNVLTSVTGDTVYLGKQVFDLPGDDIDITGQPGYGGWTGIEGNPDCPAGYSQQGLIADTTIIFRNGFIDICYPVDMRGDINLNGFSYEMADLVMFSNYFLHGLDALPSTGRESSIAFSDLNHDGVYLTFRDLAYLMRVVYGDAVPYVEPVTDTMNVTLMLDAPSHSFVVTSDSLLAGVFVVVSGEITPTFTVPTGFIQDYYFDGSVTRILILGDADHRYAGGLWFTYEGEGSILFAETADWHNNRIVSNIPNTWLTCGDFNRTTQVDISDVVFLIQHIFAAGAPPDDRNRGDINCDGSCDIGDAVLLLKYVFTGGPAPCDGCK